MILDNVGTIIGIVVGAASLLGLTGSIVNGKRKDGYNEILKASNDELRNVVGDKDKRIAELEAELKIAEAARDTANGLKDAAVAMAQSRPEFERLGTQMIKQHKEVLKAMADLTLAIGRLAEKDRA